MNARTFQCRLMAVAFCLCMQVAAAAEATSPAGTDAVREMADMLINLNHYPSPSEKAALQRIQNDSVNSEHVRTLAATLHNLEHYASKADKEKLQHILSDDAADADVRAIARILLGLSHKPSAAAQEELRGIIARR